MQEPLTIKLEAVSEQGSADARFFLATYGEGDNASSLLVSDCSSSSSGQQGQGGVWTCTLAEMKSAVTIAPSSVIAKGTSYVIILGDGGAGSDRLLAIRQRVRVLFVW